MRIQWEYEPSGFFIIIRFLAPTDEPNSDIVYKI